MRKVIAVGKIGPMWTKTSDFVGVEVTSLIDGYSLALKYDVHRSASTKLIYNIMDHFERLAQHHRSNPDS